MAVWTYARIVLLRRRVAELRAHLGDPNPDADADLELLAGWERLHAAAHNAEPTTGQGAVDDPAHDPAVDHGAEV